ncbi:uncharacterized protein N7459_005456 [Penicillium hispanicum]|uniref:uncharacterized protein n=1 Tax=Penicillium hispanicum TaxID=1080232 RepID=UPI002541488C|nr:uncharacterized protein N7459_005456 [Penicillium hispanicum]KAJ5579471.1 hypothetical protein N7459_005456 [Penicillium hispanicum]
MVFNHLWLRGLEIWLTARLLRSPIFHQMVGRVHQRIQHYRHGIPMEESRTSLESQGANLSKFAKYFKEEIKDQMKGNPPNKLSLVPFSRSIVRQTPPLIVNTDTSKALVFLNLPKYLFALRTQCSDEIAYVFRSRVLSNDWTKVIDTDGLDDGATAAGFASGITVCLDGDEALSRMENGIHAPCPTNPNSGSSVYTTPDNNAGFASGWCTTHFTKIQKDEDDGYKNPLQDDYLMAVSILDNNGKLIARAPLQPMNTPYRITDDVTHMGGGNFTVKAGSTDSSEDEFCLRIFTGKAIAQPSNVRPVNGTVASARAAAALHATPTRRRARRL